ncbi:MAG: hypothetical protein LC650_00070 [Actinobacteria bacterium]|nr:hypothetical protein [Actinomycetota bacterium]
MADFDSFLEVLKDDDFEERPVDLETFLYSEDFMGLPPMSEHQIKLLEALTQIYRRETVVELWGQEEGERLWESTHQEIIFQLGKGSGKDFVTSVGFARIVYLLLCLKDPAKYYGKPPGDSIALLNVAINAKQAKNVFFRYFKQRIKGCPWFAGKYDPPTQDMVRFDKNVEAHSGHSEREAWEGYNFIVVVLDEISGFATEEETTAEGGTRDKTADAIYKMYKASVSSRFPRYGKLALLSFPRYRGDYIQQRYNAAVAEKEVVTRTHSFKLHENWPDNDPSNEFVIEWEEDHIISYTEDGVFALKRPTWDVNPIINIDDLKSDFIRDKLDALSRFACMPPDAVDAFFKDRSIIERVFVSDDPGPFREDWTWRPNFKPDKNRSYYVHVDLAYKHDRAAVAMASVEDWVTVRYGRDVSHSAPRVRLDAVRYWTPTKTENVNLEDVKDFIVYLKRAGFPLRLVTFDKWNCLPGYSWLFTDKGMVQIGDYKNLDAQVATHRGVSPASDFFENGVREVHRVKTRFGYTLDGTGNHPIMTQRGWVNIDDILPGDKVKLRAPGVFAEQDNCSIEEARALGTLVAEGHREKKPGRYVFKITSKDEEVVDTLYADLKTIKPDLHRTASLRYEDSEVWSTCHYNTYGSKQVYNRLVELGWIGGSFDEEIPWAVLRSGLDVQRAFLSGLFDGDGHISLHDQTLGVYYETRSHRLAHQVRLMLLNMGILCSWHESEHKGSMRYRLCIRGQRGENFLALVPMISRRKIEQAAQYQQKMISRHGRKLRWDFDENGEVMLDIISIEPLGKMPVYDITVPGDHSFIADGLVTHNSATYRQQLQADFRISTDLLSVAKPHYEDLALTLVEKRLVAYNLPLLVDELVGLKIIKGNKVDHTRKGSKDLADAVVGAVFNVLEHEKSDGLPEVEVYLSAPDIDNKYKPEDDEPRRRSTRPMPQEIEEYLDRMAVL